MAPEYGATCGFFPVDADTLAYLETSGRDASRVALVKAYSEAQGMYRTTESADPVFTDTLELDLSTVVPSLSGPKRPQDRVALKDAAAGFATALKDIAGGRKERTALPTSKDESRYVSEGATGVDDIPEEAAFPVQGEDFCINDGHVVIAAITSCTNTSNPSVLIAAGLVARKARAFGLKAKPWVKTSLAPGSQVVTDYLTAAGLQADLDALGFNLVGYGCTTCIGNSGPLSSSISQCISDNDLVAASVLSGNRNFEGRVNPDVRANYLASPPLVVAYAIAGSMTVNVATDPLGTDKDGKPVNWSDFAGQWRIVYFGYTFCPDVCPVDAAAIGQGLAQFEKAQPALGAKVTPIFITVDPERDTAAVVGEFAANFHPRMVGLTGTPDAIAATARKFKRGLQVEELSGGESSWLEMAVRKVVRRIGEHAAGVPLSRITMQDLPAL